MSEASLSETGGLVTNLTLEQLDRDGALQESIAGLYGDTRAELLRKAAIGGITLLAALASPPVVRAEVSKQERCPNPAVRPQLRVPPVGLLHRDRARRDDREHGGAESCVGEGRSERTSGQHVKIIKQVLGDAATKKPFFNFRGNTETESRFTRTAVAMEDLTTALTDGRDAQPALASPRRGGVFAAHG